ncbi:unnamed protein product [Cuscuta campestris]|uniref:BZIP domain-containing protein n=1 Tax=Cuscuta campestris TaxID=132261 RepID=A0A484K0Q1_9ASTE|nr:unnamed protein product [Cuscuta campestris]
MVSQGDEVESPLLHKEFKELGRLQSSIYNLTLDEFQNRGGKSFGSMNMDEFLTSIWSHENNNKEEEGGSFAIPEPLCRKTVDEVWSEIQETEQPADGNRGSTVAVRRRESNQASNYREMTLEEFLVKAGVVRDRDSFRSGNDLAGGDYDLGSPQCCTGSIRRNSYFLQQGVGYGGGRGGAVVSPVSSEGHCGSRHGSEVGGRVSRKRVVDGPEEVVVARRQRRMIKNRESAARSRARKQAYTEELEAEVNHLREENSQLRLALEELENNINQEECSVK